MKMTDKLEKQMQRELAAREAGLKKLHEDMHKNEQVANASNNIYGVVLKRQYLGEMIDEVNRQIENTQKGFASTGTTERARIIENCLGYVIKRSKKGDSIKSEQMLEPEIACHVALQMTLDAVMLPDKPRLKKSRQTTRQFDGTRPTIAELQYEIGKQIHKQMTYKLLDENFGRWFAQKLKQSKGDTAARSSTFYSQGNLDRYIQSYKDYCISRGDDRSKVFDSAVWTFKEYQVVGSWLLGIVQRTGLFAKKQSSGSPREQTLKLSKLGELKINDLIAQAEKVVCQPLPMIIPPTDMTKDKLGGWIEDAAVLNTDTNTSWKGRVELSDLHLKFYNHQQQQAFKINPFVWDIIKTLKGNNEQLGDFKAFKRTPLMKMWLELKIPAYEWDACNTREEQDALIRKHPRFKEVNRARSKRYNEQQAQKIEGKPSEYLYDMVTQCADEDELYIPIEPDFRSRFTCRTSYLSYQGNDVARGLLTFANDYPIDSQTKHYLSIHLANQVGLDKESYATRIDWVEQHLDVIESIAVMNDGDRDDFERGIDYLKEFGKDEEFKLAAACREYYELFIARIKTTTNLPCAIDATCSGQQLIAGFLRSAELAERVNVLPTTKPGDIYRDTMDRMLELAAEDDEANFTRPVLKALKGSIGRKTSKKGFMSGQYGSGSKRQLEDMLNYINDETDLKLKNSEVLLIKKYWSVALEDICKIRVVFNWFKNLVQELHELGKDEVIIPTKTGSVIHQRYPVPKITKITTFNFGSSDYKTSTTNGRESTNKADLGKWKTATAANTIHGAGDASLLCMALHDFEHPFYCVHDSISTHAGMPLKHLQKRLKDAYKEVVSFDLWNEVRRANGLPVDDSYLPALIGDLKLDDVDKAEYLFC